MTQTQTYTRTEADPRDFPVRLKNAFDDGDVIGDGWEVNRWQKYGNDRLYFENAEGYIDVESGAVKEGAPVTNVEVEQVKGDTWVHYYIEETDIDHTTEKFVAALKR
jgi:hypothetical protein